MCLLVPSELLPTNDKYHSQHFHHNRRPIGSDLIHRLPLVCIKLPRIKAHPKDGIGTEGPGMLGQLFQGIIPGLCNHFEVTGLLAAEDGADATQEIADDIAGSDTRAIDRPDDTYHTHAGAVVDGEDNDIIFQVWASPRGYLLARYLTVFQP